MLRYGVMCRRAVLCGMEWSDLTWCGIMCCGVVWCEVLWCGMMSRGSYPM